MRTLFISIFFLLLDLLLSAQITIDQTDMPQSGDTMRLSLAVDLGSLNYEETGNNFVWDFSELVPFAQRVDTFVSVQQTPWFYQPVFLLSANLASPGQNFDQFPGFQVTDFFNFYKNSNADFRSVGFGVTLNGLPIPNKFDEPDIIYRFPLSAGNIDSSLSSYALDIPGLGYYGGWKKRISQTDGWGELTTPYGTFDVLRIKSDIIQFDSLYIDSLGFGIPFLRNYTEYKWLGESFGLPLCMVTDDGILPTIEYIDSVRTMITTSQDYFIHDPEFLILPNPFVQNFTISYLPEKGSSVMIELFNLNGRKIFAEVYHTDQPSRQFLEISGLQIPTGIYFLKVSINSKVTTFKLIKAVRI